MSRPEHLAPPEIFYNEEESLKYSRNSHIQDIQSRLSHRAIELLLLPQDKRCFILDIGCGSGLSGESLTELGHDWIGVDISPHMLDVAIQRETEGDLILADIGQPLRFRPGIFDGAISVSTVQWLCNADKKEHDPYKRCLCFFKWLYSALAKGARAAFQFYPEHPRQLEMITSAALRSGFGGGLVIDFPNSTKAKKHYLVIWAGFSGAPPTLPEGLSGDDEHEEHAEHIAVAGRDRQTGRRKSRKAVKDRNWVIRKKEAQRHAGLSVRPDTKYTGRKRKDKF